MYYYDNISLPNVAFASEVLSFLEMHVLLKLKSPLLNTVSAMDAL